MTDRSERFSHWRDRLITPLGAVLCALVALSVVLALRQTGRLFRLEVLAFDRITTARPHTAPQDSPCVIVRISERDITNLLRQYPISDRQLAELLNHLQAMQPRTIGVDLFRDIKYLDRETGFADEALATAWQQRNVFGINLIDGDERNRVGPPWMLGGRARVGFNNVPDDADGVVRRALLFMFDPTTQRNEPAFGLRLATHYLASEDVRMTPAEDGTEALLLGNARIARWPAGLGAYIAGRVDADPAEQMMLAWRSPREFERYDITDVMSPDFDRSRIQDRLVLIGVLNRSVKDYVPTPISAYTPGVEFHAHVAHQVIDAARGTHRLTVQSWGNITEQVYISAFALIGGLLGLLARRPVIYLFLLGLAGALVVMSAWFGLQRDFWIPLVPPLLGLFTSAVMSTAWVLGVEWGNRQAWTALTGKLVSPAIAKELWRSRRELFVAGRMRPRQLTATVLFFDLKGFTAIAEKIEPATMIGLLNELFEVMAGVIESNGGVVNKYIGDQIMALFGPPLPRTTEAEFRQDATNAVRCAIQLRAALVRINETWSTQGRPKIYMRVGIYTGPLVAGSVGSRERLEYTVIGDTVNIASRLESVDKANFDDQIAPGGCRIFIGKPTFERLDGEFRIRPVPVGEIKGKAEGVSVYAVL